MKCLSISLLFVWGCVLQTNAQSVGIGTATPNSKAALDISSANKGLLIPRMGAANRTAIASPPKGLMVYDTTHSAFFYFDGGTWRPVYEKNYDSAAMDYSSIASVSANMITASTVYISAEEKSGYIFDDGGPTGNYALNNNSTVYFNINDSILAVKIVIEEMNIEAAHDSLLILDVVTGLPTDTIARLTGTQTGTYVVNSRGNYVTGSIRIVFKSDNVVNASGFKIRWGKITGSANLQMPAPLYGWYFDNKKIAAMGGLQKNNYWDTDSVGFGSFSYGFGNKARGDYSSVMGYDSKAMGFASIAIGNRNTASGYNSTAIGANTIASNDLATAIGAGAKASGDRSVALGYYTTAGGSYSTAMGSSTTAGGSHSAAIGFSTTASGEYSTTMGDNTIASGRSSTAIGDNTNASADYSTAMGFYTTASGNGATAMGGYTTAGGGFSTAMGYRTIAIGSNSTAMGTATIASGDHSTAMGNYVSTSDFPGAFAIGDNSTTTIMNTFEPNGFRARFANGYRLFTNSACTIGAYLNQNANSWATLSDVRRKEKFIPVDGEYFLHKISVMPLTTWNYKGQDSKTLRHYGPMAQDFYAAFGKDKLGTIGCDTLINQQDFLGVNLIAIQALEKRTQQIEILQKDNAELKRQLLLLKKRMDELEAKKNK